MKRHEFGPLVGSLVVVGMLLPALAVSEETKEEQAAPAPKAEQVRLYVEGAFCAGCAGVLDDAISQGGVKKASKVPVNVGRGHVIVLADLAHNADLSQLAKMINAAATPHRSRAKPGVSIEMFAKLDQDSAKTAREALAKIEGVDAEGSQIDAERGVIAIRLTGEKKITVASLTGDLKKAGIDAGVVTDDKAKRILGDKKEKEEKDEKKEEEK